MPAPDSTAADHGRRGLFGGGGGHLLGGHGGGHLLGNGAIGRGDLTSLLAKRTLLDKLGDIGRNRPNERNHPAEQDRVESVDDGNKVRHYKFFGQSQDIKAFAVTNKQTGTAEAWHRTTPQSDMWVHTDSRGHRLGTLQGQMRLTESRQHSFLKTGPGAGAGDGYWRTYGTHGGSSQDRFVEGGVRQTFDSQNRCVSWRSKDGFVTCGYNKKNEINSVRMTDNATAHTVSFTYDERAKVWRSSNKGGVEGGVFKRVEVAENGEVTLETASGSEFARGLDGSRRFTTADGSITEYNRNGLLVRAAADNVDRRFTWVKGTIARVTDTGQDGIERVRFDRNTDDPVHVMTFAVQRDGSFGYSNADGTTVIDRPGGRKLTMDSDGSMISAVGAGQPEIRFLYDRQGAGKQPLQLFEVTKTEQGEMLRAWTRQRKADGSLGSEYVHTTADGSKTVTAELSAADGKLKVRKIHTPKGDWAFDYFGNSDEFSRAQIVRGGKTEVWSRKDMKTDVWAQGSAQRGYTGARHMDFRAATDGTVSVREAPEKEKGRRGHEERRPGLFKPRPDHDKIKPAVEDDDNTNYWTSYHLDGRVTTDKINGVGTRLSFNAMNMCTNLTAGDGSHAECTWTGKELTALNFYRASTGEHTIWRLDQRTGLYHDLTNKTMPVRKLALGENGEVSFETLDKSRYSVQLDAWQSVRKGDGSTVEADPTGIISRTRGMGVQHIFLREEGKITQVIERSKKNGERVIYDSSTHPPLVTIPSAGMGDFAYRNRDGTTTVERSNGLKLALDQDGDVLSATKPTGFTRTFDLVGQGFGKEVTGIHDVRPGPTGFKKTSWIREIDRAGHLGRDFVAIMPDNTRQVRSNITVLADGSYNYKMRGDGSLDKPHISRLRGMDADGGMASDSIDEAREAFVEAIEGALDHQRKAFLKEHCPQFEQRMLGLGEAQIKYLGYNADKTISKMESKIAQSYDRLTEMVSEESNKTFMPHKSRVELASQQMFHLADPSTGDQGAHPTCWMESAHNVTRTINPQADCRFLKEVTLTGTFLGLNNGVAGTPPRLFKFYRGQFEAKPGQAEHDWTIANARKSNSRSWVDKIHDNGRITMWFQMEHPDSYWAYFATGDDVVGGPQGTPEHVQKNPILRNRNNNRFSSEAPDNGYVYDPSTGRVIPAEQLLTGPYSDFVTTGNGRTFHSAGGNYHQVLKTEMAISGEFVPDTSYVSKNGVDKTLLEYGCYIRYSPGHMFCTRLLRGKDGQFYVYRDNQHGENDDGIIRRLDLTGRETRLFNRRGET